MTYTLLLMLGVFAIGTILAADNASPGIQSLGQVTVLVRDQAEALRFYTEVLGLEKRQDQPMGPESRWLTVAPKGQSWPEIVLLKPSRGMHGSSYDDLLSRVGQGTTWVFYTDDCRKMYETLRARGVKFVRSPEDLPYGTQAVFEDLYGNPYALISRKKQ
jgi:predicted enzyme related to lactoylglutathione lyase